MGAVPCCQPSSSAGNPCLYPTSWSMEKDTKGKCTSESLHKLLSLSSGRFKNCNWKVHSGTQITLVHAELILSNQTVFPAGAGVCWGGFWGGWFMLHVFPTPGNALGKPETPLASPRTTGYVDLYFTCTWHLWWKKDTFRQSSQICFFPLNHYVAFTFH